MKTLMTALRFSILIFILGGLVYPLIMTGLGQALFPKQANGSLIYNAQGQVIGSALIGQNFTQPDYFHPRPSENSYDASNSGGSNYGATSQKLIDRIAQDATTYQKDNHWDKPIPVDAITASGSGVDPDISVANALAQVSRVATARKLPEAKIKQTVLSLSESRFAESPYVNVLKLNLALDKLRKTDASEKTP